MSGLKNTSGIFRGDIFYADLDPVRGHEQAGTRPMVVISHDTFNRNSGTAIVMALTSQEPRAGFPLTLELTGVQLPKRSWVKISQVRLISTERLSRRLGRASPSILEKLVEGLNDIVS